MTKAKAEPVIAAAHGIATATKGDNQTGAPVQKAMTAAAQTAHDEGVTDVDEVSSLIAAARDASKAKLAEADAAFEAARAKADDLRKQADQAEGEGRAEWQRLRTEAESAGIR